MIEFVPISESEFEAYAAESALGYGREKVRAGQWSEAEAPELARKALEGLLPKGLGTPGHFLCRVRDGARGIGVGVLWYAITERAGRPVAYVYDLAIDPGHRRRGYARRTLQALETVARSRGASAIDLHVFAHNSGARALYDGAGFIATSVTMTKELL